MSAPTGPDWYPSKQFAHVPPPPSGAPTSAAAPASAVRSEAHADSSAIRRLVDKLLRRG